jgi:predicted component of type VI protein secretion system
LINRVEPVCAHLCSLSGLHPEELYRALVALAGELATFNSGTKRAVQYPAYRHDALRDSFQPVVEHIRDALSMVMDTRAVSIPLEERQFGLRVAVIRLHVLRTGSHRRLLEPARHIGRFRDACGGRISGPANGVLGGAPISARAGHFTLIA